MRPTAIETWHSLLKTRDAAALETLLAPDAVFHSPVAHTPQRGRAIVKAYLAAASNVLADETFRYVEEWIGPHSAVLEFVSTVAGVEINGADFISWNAAGQIEKFKVMVRPLKAITLLHQMMAAQLALDAGGKPVNPSA